MKRLGEWWKEWGFVPLGIVVLYWCVAWITYACRHTQWERIDRPVLTQVKEAVTWR